MRILFQTKWNQLYYVLNKVKSICTILQSIICNKIRILQWWHLKKSGKWLQMNVLIILITGWSLMTAIPAHFVNCQDVECSHIHSAPNAIFISVSTEIATVFVGIIHGLTKIHNSTINLLIYQRLQNTHHRQNVVRKQRAWKKWIYHDVKSWLEEVTRWDPIKKS